MKTREGVSRDRHALIGFGAIWARWFEVRSMGRTVPNGALLLWGSIGNSTKAH